MIIQVDVAAVISRLACSYGNRAGDAQADVPFEFLSCNEGHMKRIAIAAGDSRGERSHKRIGAIAVVASFFMAFAGATVFAQSYPTKPIRLIVPSCGGGAPDILGRLVAAKLSDGLGQQIIVENRPGAGGSIGMEAVAKSTADGYTLGLATTSALSVAPTLFPNLGYDPVRSFEAVSQLTSGNFVIFVNSSVPANTLRELIDLAKSKPGQLNYASVGNGTPHHIAGEAFKLAAGVNMVHVPYKAQAHLGLLSNDVQVMFEGLGPFLSHIRSGKIRALAVAGPERFGQIPDVPTTAEAGLPDYEITANMGLVAPRETPPDVIRRVNEVLVKVMATNEVKEAFFNQGLRAISSSPEQYAALIRDDVVRWARASKAAKAKID